MSNAVAFDPFLVRYLVGELTERLGGRRCAVAPVFSADRAVTVPLHGNEQLRIDLHPTRGWFRILPSPHDFDPELDAVCAEILTRPDERSITFRLDEVGRFREQTRHLVLELQTNQWNAIVHGEDGRIQSVLNTRTGGARVLVPGETYEPPPPTSRYGAGPVDEADARRRWLTIVSGAAPAERRQVILAGFAYTGAVNVGWILGGDDHEFDIEAAFTRWWWIRSLPGASPCLVRSGRGMQPYPIELPGLESKRAASILAAMEEVAEKAPEPADQAHDDARRFVEARKAAAAKKVERLRQQLSGAEDGAGIRALGDLLLAKLHEVPRGASLARLEDWEGRPVEIPLDPQLTPVENAGKLYDAARRRERAAEQIPKLIQTAERDLARWHAAADSIGRGEVADWLIRAMRQRAGTASAKGDHASPRSLPYRVFRTSGGLEVRVGRGSKENDRLTFRESAPNDVWLHAQSVPGSHVILRWADAEASPPARDLAEAAQLAAVHSRARTSSTVAVDWTRRKYVRKPRGAGPGLVIPQRVKTLFVEPDQAVVDRLAEEF